MKFVLVMTLFTDNLAVTASLLPQLLVHISTNYPVLASNLPNLLLSRHGEKKQSDKMSLIFQGCCSHCVFNEVQITNKEDQIQLSLKLKHWSLTYRRC